MMDNATILVEYTSATPKRKGTGLRHCVPEVLEALLNTLKMDRCTATAIDTRAGNKIVATVDRSDGGEWSIWIDDSIPRER